MFRLDHAVFPTRDAAASLSFYRETLGLPLVNALAGDDWGGRRWLMMIFGLAGGQELVRVALEDGAVPEWAGPADARHYAFSVDTRAEWDAWRTRLADQGVVAWEEAHGERVSLYFRDPDDVILEITHPASDARAEESADALAEAKAWIAKVAARIV